MIALDDLAGIRNGVDDYWRAVLAESGDEFFAMATGKEGGHQLSDRVDQLTTSFIHSTYPTRSGFQHKNGSISPRSMGDIWFRSQCGEWNPINIKTGLVGA